MRIMTFAWQREVSLCSVLGQGVSTATCFWRPHLTGRNRNANTNNERNWQNTQINWLTDWLTHWLTCHCLTDVYRLYRTSQPRVLRSSHQFLRANDGIKLWKHHSTFPIYRSQSSYRPTLHNLRRWKASLKRINQKPVSQIATFKRNNTGHNVHDVSEVGSSHWLPLC